MTCSLRNRVSRNIGDFLMARLSDTIGTYARSHSQAQIGIFGTRDATWRYLAHCSTAQHILPGPSGWSLMTPWQSYKRSGARSGVSQRKKNLPFPPNLFSSPSHLSCITMVKATVMYVRFVMQKTSSLTDLPYFPAELLAVSVSPCPCFLSKTLWSPI